MKINPQKVQDLVKQGASGLIATSRDFLRRFDTSAPQDLSLIHI